MGDKKHIPDDMDLFRREMEDVRPLKTAGSAPPKRARPAPRPHQREGDERAVLDELPEMLELEGGLEIGEELRFLRPGYQKRYLQRLQRGRHSIRDHLDLHHMTVETARRALLEFIDQSVRAGYGCVRIVHGKGLRSRGRSRLKEMADHMLRRHPAVIAFSSCRPVDGGTGAVVILLRSR